MKRSPMRLRTHPPRWRRGARLIKPLNTSRSWPSRALAAVPVCAHSLHTNSYYETGPCDRRRVTVRASSATVIAEELVWL